MVNLKTGVYPTMITPFNKKGDIDYGAVRAIVDWYIEKGCDGIFAVCQSSEMQWLSLYERIKLAATVKEHANGRISVVASGHCSDSIEQQIVEVNEIGSTGVDAVALVSNRLDLHNDGDRLWIKNAEHLLEGINSNINLGIYECPIPYKRLMSDRLWNWCISTGRFSFIKDTCCDHELLKKRLELTKNTGIYIFNANAQTLLYSLRHGGAGYSGIMANFHPELYVWLCEHFDDQPQQAEYLQAFLGMLAFTECMTYPVTAKYHMNLIGIPMCLDSRWKDKKDFTGYQKDVIEQELLLEKYAINLLERAKRGDASYARS